MSKKILIAILTLVSLFQEYYLSSPPTPITASPTTNSIDSLCKVKNCLTCEVGDINKCNVCMIGFNNLYGRCTNDKLVIICKVDNCSICVIETKCIMCKYGFEMKVDGSCKKEEKEQKKDPSKDKSYRSSDNETYKVIGIVVGVIAFCIGIGCRICRCMRNEEAARLNRTRVVVAPSYQPPRPVPRAQPAPRQPNRPLQSVSRQNNSNDNIEPAPGVPVVPLLPSVNSNNDNNNSNLYINPNSQSEINNDNFYQSQAKDVDPAMCAEVQGRESETADFIKNNDFNVDLYKKIKK